jgi:hypothetical protein
LDNHELVSIEHKTIRECLRDYYEHPEAKAANPHDVGVLERVAVCVIDQVYCGKESNDVLVELDDESEGVLPHPDVQTFGRHGLGAAIRAHGANAVATARPDQPVHHQTLYKILAGDVPNRTTIKRVLASLDACPLAPGCCADGLGDGMSSYEDRRRQRARTRRERRCGAD